MTFISVMFSLVLLAYVAWALSITVRLWRSELLYRNSQKALQTAFLWLVPIAGPGIVAWLLARGDMKEPGGMASPEVEAARAQEGRYTGGGRI